MPVLSLLVALIIVGVALYLVNTYVPLAPPIRTIINVVVVLIVILWLLQVFGLFGGMTVPRLR